MNIRFQSIFINSFQLKKFVLWIFITVEFIKCYVILIHNNNFNCIRFCHGVWWKKKNSSTCPSSTNKGSILESSNKSYVLYLLIVFQGSTQLQVYVGHLKNYLNSLITAVSFVIVKDKEQDLNPIRIQIDFLKIIIARRVGYWFSSVDLKPKG